MRHQQAVGHADGLGDFALVIGHDGLDQRLDGFVLGGGSRQAGEGLGGNDLEPVRGDGVGKGLPGAEAGHGVVPDGLGLGGKRIEHGLAPGRFEGAVPDFFEFRHARRMDFREIEDIHVVLAGDGDADPVESAFLQFEGGGHKRGAGVIHRRIHARERGQSAGGIAGLPGFFGEIGNSAVAVGDGTEGQFGARGIRP
jgi:hypothetical protein